MSQVMVHLGGVTAVLVTVSVTYLFAPSLTGWLFWTIHGAAFISGCALWLYSPLPDSNIPGADKGQYWGWPGSNKQTRTRSINHE